jgi:hypothetical protein
MELDKSANVGYIDMDGNEWCKVPARQFADRSHLVLDEFEWDVFLSYKGKIKFKPIVADLKHIRESKGGIRVHDKLSTGLEKIMSKSFNFNEIVQCISRKKEYREYQGRIGIINGIGKEEDGSISNYGVAMLTDEDEYEDGVSFYPEDLQSTGKIAHPDFNKSDVVLRISNEGNVLEIQQSTHPYFIAMIGLKHFIYEEEPNSIKIKLKHGVYENNKSFEIVKKENFSKWDNTETISEKKQLEIMKNFKENMLTQFGVEIDYK